MKDYATNYRQAWPRGVEIPINLSEFHRYSDMRKKSIEWQTHHKGIHTGRITEDIKRFTPNAIISLEWSTHQEFTLYGSRLTTPIKLRMAINNDASLATPTIYVENREIHMHPTEIPHAASMRRCSALVRGSRCLVEFRLYVLGGIRIRLPKWLSKGDRKNAITGRMEACTCTNSTACETNRTLTMKCLWTEYSIARSK
jgi:hypothetical protein